jgi:hypothetical protein
MWRKGWPTADGFAGARAAAKRLAASAAAPRPKRRARALTHACAPRRADRALQPLRHPVQARLALHLVRLARHRRAAPRSPHSALDD